MRSKNREWGDKKLKNLAKILGYACFFCGMGMGLSISYLIVGLFGANMNVARDIILTITIFIIGVCLSFAYIIHRDKKNRGDQI